MRSLIVIPLCLLVSGCAVNLTKNSDVPLNELAHKNVDQVEHDPAGSVQNNNRGGEQLAKKVNSDIGKKRGISRYLPGYTYIDVPSDSPTAHAVWVTHEENRLFHVPWYVGGDWFVDSSDQIVVDPVNKTISLGFDVDSASLETCTQTLREEDRAINGYSPCNSQFYTFEEIVEELEPKAVVEKVERTFWQRLMGGAEDGITEGDTALRSPDDADPLEEGSIDTAPATPEVTYRASLDLDTLALTVVQLNLLSKAERENSGESESLEVLERRLTNKIKSSQKYFERSLVKLQREIINDYTSGADTNRLKVKKQTIDKSGYFNYDINWPVNVSLKPSPVSVKDIEYGQFLTEFKRYTVTDASKPLANLTLAKMKKQYLSDRQKVLRELKQQTRYYQVACPAPEFIGDYQVVVKCPEETLAHTDNLSVTLTYEVLAKRFDLMIPRYTNYNNDLTIVADAEVLSLKNNSDSNININAIEWLANNAAQNITRNTDKSELLAIAKGQTVNIPLAEIVGSDLKKELVIPYLSKRQALRKHLDYGFDVSYHLVDGEEGIQNGVSNRLNQKNRYNLNELLQSR